MEEVVAGVLYKKFQAWDEKKEQTDDFFEYSRKVYQVEHPERAGIMSLLSTFVAPSIEAAASKEILASISCSGSTNTDTTEKIERNETTNSVCPPGYTMVSNKCFKYFSTPTGWPEAENSCNEIDGHLVTLLHKDLLSVNAVLQFFTSVWTGGRKKPGFPSLYEGWWWGNVQKEMDEPITLVEADGLATNDGTAANALYWSPAGFGDHTSSPGAAGLSPMAFLCQTNSYISASPVNIPPKIKSDMYPCPETKQNLNEEIKLPPIDLYMNPVKKEAKENIIKKHESIGSAYYTKKRMQTVFRDLFKLFWYSRLPCFDQPLISSASLLRSCQVAGNEEP